MSGKTLISTILVFIFAFSGVCLGATTPPAEPGNTTHRDVVKETKEAAKTTGDFAWQKKDEYVRSVEREYDRLSREISDLRANTSAWASAQYKTQVARLEASKKTAGRKLDELKRASSKTWESMKKGMDSAMDDLRASYNDAVSRIKKG